MFCRLMADGKKSGRLSGRKTDKKKSKKRSVIEDAIVQAPTTHEVQELHSPWLPLIWILIPLIACLVYGVATRGS